MLRTGGLQWPTWSLAVWLGWFWEVDGQKAVICGYLELSLPRPFLLLFTGARNHLVYLYPG